MPCKNLKYRFLDFNQVAFWACQEAGNEFQVPFDHIKHRFIDFNLVAFWAGQDTENEFNGSLDHFKNAFLGTPKLYFGLVKKQKMSSHSMGTT